MQIETGSYVGNGTGSHLITTGLDLSGSHVVLWIMRGDVWGSSWIKTSTMGASYSQPVDGGTPQNNRITALGASGFTLDSSNSVNENLVTFHYVAMVDSGADMYCLSYTGDGVNNRAMTNPGFLPSVVMIFSTQASFTVPGYKTSGHSSADAKIFDNGDPTDFIKSLDATGFTLGDGGNSNGNTKTYSAVCFAAACAQVGIISYTGDSTDNRQVGAFSSTPSFAFTQVYHPGFVGGDAMLRSDTMATDYSMPVSGPFALDGNTNNKIQDFHSAGIEIGSHASVNRIGSPFVAVVFSPTVTHQLSLTGALTFAGSLSLANATQPFQLHAAVTFLDSLVMVPVDPLLLSMSGGVTFTDTLGLATARAIRPTASLRFRTSLALSIPLTPVLAGVPTYRVEQAFSRQIGIATWYDFMTDRLQSAQITRGRPDELSGTQAGTMTLLFDNDDGALDLSNPNASLSPTLDGAYPMRVIATFDGNDYSLGTGFVDELQHQRRGAYGADKVVRTVDWFKELGQAQPAFYRISPGGASNTFPGASIGDRIADLLDTIPLATDGERALSSGSYTVRSEIIENTPFLQLIDWMCKLERIGVFFIRGDGYVTFLDLLYRQTQMSRGTFGIGDGAVPVADFTVTEANRGIYNEVHVVRPTYSDEDQIASDANSILRYGKGVYTLDPKAADQLADDLTAKAWAEDFLTTYKKPRYRIDSITLDPHCGEMEAEAWWHVLDGEIGDRITVNLPLERASGYLIHEDYHIEGVEHHIDFKGLEHTVTWRLSRRAGTVGFL